MKYILLQNSVSISRWHSYVLKLLKEKGMDYCECDSIDSVIDAYNQNPHNSFIIVDAECDFSSFDLQRLRGLKVYSVLPCSFHLQRSRERIVGQIIKDIFISGSSVQKCIVMCSCISDYDPCIALSCISENHLYGQLARSQAHIHFQINEQQANCRYCISTDSEQLCFMILNDNPSDKYIIDEINLFFEDNLPLDTFSYDNYYLHSLIHNQRLAEIATQALKMKTTFSLKPIYLPTLQKALKTEIIKSNESLSKEVSQNVSTSLESTAKEISFLTTGTASINSEALLEPLSKIQEYRLVGFSSSDVDRAREFYKKVIYEGARYVSDLVSLVQSAFSGVIYIPSLPGVRKEEEMLLFTSQQIRNSSLNPSHRIVLAEKPAFANSLSAIRFRQNMQTQKNSEENLFFGWHYIHHPVIQEIVFRIQDSLEFGPIRKISATFTRPKPFQSNHRMFEPKQGGCGLDRFCYPLHFALTLAKFQVKSDKFKVLHSSHLTCNQIYGTSIPHLDNIEGRLECSLLLNQQLQVELMASMETNTPFHSEAHIIFENSTEIVIQEFIHPHILYQDSGLYCASIKMPFQNAFQPLPINVQFDKQLTSYDFQIRSMANIFTQKNSYDQIKDRLNLSTSSNLYLHEVLDAVFESTGIQMKGGL